MRWLFREIHHSLSGKDGRLSIRRFLALFFSMGLMHLSVLHITTCREVQESFIWAFVSLIVGLLGITTGQTIAEQFTNKKKKHDTDQETGV